MVRDMLVSRDYSTRQCYSFHLTSELSLAFFIVGGLSRLTVYRF